MNENEGIIIFAIVFVVAIMFLLTLAFAHKSEGEWDETELGERIDVWEDEE